MNNEIYLVGGAVRDQLMGIPAHDRDYVVVGSSPQEMEALGYIPVGTDFPVFLHPKTKEEYALARTERKTGRGYKGFAFDASKTVTLEQDLARRDLTINSMALSANDQLVDPFNGQTDLQQKCLRHTTAAFSEDPVRVLRTARFWARFGPEWHIHNDTIALIKSMRKAGELQYLVAERVWKELEKALEENYSELFFECLRGLGVFAELDELSEAQFTSMKNCLRCAGNMKREPVIKFALVMLTLKQSKKSSDLANAQFAIDFCHRWRIPKRFERLAVIVLNDSQACHNFMAISAEEIYALLIERLKVLDEPLLFEQFLKACHCDYVYAQFEPHDTAYPQAKRARELVLILQSVDRKAIVQRALSKGVKGRDIGEAVKTSLIRYIEDWLDKNT